jgi:hypothetical protein
MNARTPTRVGCGDEGTPTLAASTPGKTLGFGWGSQAHPNLRGCGTGINKQMALYEFLRLRQKLNIL